MERSPLTAMLLWLGPTDMAAIFVIALLLFGPEQLPKVARQVGEVMRHMQNTTQSFMLEMDRAAREHDIPPAAIAPSADALSADVPSADALSAEMPSADALSADVPSADALSAEMPSADVPSADVPSADVPSADAPSADVPSADVPSADAASADVPRAAPPSDKATEEPPEAP